MGTMTRRRLATRGSIAFVLLLAFAAAPALAQRARREGTAAKGKPEGEVATADSKAKTYTFNSRFYRVTSDVPDKALANDIARHMDAVYAEYSARMAGFRANPTAAVRPDERMPLYVMRRYDDYVELLAKTIDLAGSILARA